MIESIDLIGKSKKTVDSIGQIVLEDEKTVVFADVESITQSEFMAAGQAGHKPELRFLVWRADYNNQQYVDYNGKRYSIYRTYEAINGRIELYAERRVGNVKESDS